MKSISVLHSLPLKGAMGGTQSKLDILKDGLETIEPDTAMGVVGFVIPIIQ